MTRLTEEMVIARAKQSDLSLIKKLNCWGSDLSDVSIIKRMRGVEVLALSVNQISTLAPFEDCTKLQELYLRKNNISDINEIRYLQNLPALRYLWLEENPMCENAGPNYRAMILRALPSLKKLDNVDVTQEEVDEAMNSADTEDVYGDEYEQQQPTQQQRQQQQQQQQYYQQQQQQQQQQAAAAAAATAQYQVQHSPPQTPHQQQQTQAQQHGQYTQRRSSSPFKEPAQLASPIANLDANAIELTNNHNSKPTTPEKEILQSPPSPKYNTNTKEQRLSYHQYDRSPGSDQDSPQTNYRERTAPIPPSISTHSMKEYYQSDRPSYQPQHYRHSQSDLTEWDEHPQAQHAQQQQYGSQYHLNQRRSAGTERDMAAMNVAAERYGAYRNGNARENGEWDDTERPRSSTYANHRRPDGPRYSDSVSNVSVMNHCAAYHHRRPVNRYSNLLSAALCIIKELDLGSLEVLEHAVRCRLNELAGE